MQQRAIPAFVPELVLTYGTTHHDQNGAEVHYLDKRSRRRIGDELNESFVARCAHYLNCYVVTDSSTGRIITVGYRTRRMRRY
jgi:hypothetical protein